MNKTLIIHPEELNKDWIDKIASLGCTGIGIHPAGGAVASETLERLISCFDDKEFTQLLDYACEKGLEIEYEMHAARYLLPEKYYKNNPEYFRMNKSGERVADYNFCVSNEDVLKIVEENALDLAKKLYRSSKKFYFWMDDAKDSFCHCEKCKNLSPSDQQMKVLNRIIKKLRSEISDANIAYLAYFDTLSVPQKEKCEEGIFMEFAPYERDFKRKAEEMNVEDIEILKNMIKFFGKKNSKILEYWYDNSLFSKYTKPPQKLEVNNEFVIEDCEFYKNIGAECISSFACFLGEDYKELYGEPDISAFEFI